MIKSSTFVILLSTLIAVSYGSDWLDGGYVGSGDYGEIGQYFTDPIFYTSVPIYLSGAYYPAFDRRVILREPVVLGKYTPRSPLLSYQSLANISINPPSAWQSDFRNRSLAAMQWETFQKNWTSTMNYASTKSSLRIKEGSTWRSI